MKLIFTVLAICTWTFYLVLPFPALGQQPWMKAVKNKKNPNFFEVQQAFNDYWKEKVPTSKSPIPKGQGYKQFKRWEWFWEARVSRDGTFPDPAVIMQEWDKYLATHPNARKRSPANKLLPAQDLQKGPLPGAVPAATAPALSPAGGWVPLGPSSSLGGYSGVGRLNCIAFHPTDVNTFWVGSPSGGLWKTTTGGTSWTTLTDNLPTLGVSAVVLNAANPSIMYIATGDDIEARTNAVGVLKSTNGGATWTATGLSYAVSQQQLVKDLIMHPANPLILLAATSEGIYRTTDGGTSWTLRQTGHFAEILFKPGEPNTVYASARFSGNDFTSQIFRSLDNGASWSQVTAFNSFNRIALAVTPANPAVVGALCSDMNTSGFGGYYTSTNSGASFTLTYGASGLNLLGWSGGVDTGGQGWYDLCLAISPSNANVVYAGGIDTWKSLDGGSSWTLNTQWYGGTSVPTVHADKHYMAFNPLAPGTLYQCNDGGLYKTSDGGATWTDLSNGLQITQFYRLGNSALNATVTLAGSQDNGTKLRTISTYTDVLGGDGMEAIIDYDNPDVMYASMQGGSLWISTNGGAGWTHISGSLPAGAWVTPYVQDPVNPQTLYAGLGGDIYKTTDRGTSWTAISNSLTSFYYLRTLAVAPSNTQVIYTASDNEIFKTTNGGGSWSTVVSPTISYLSTALEIHPTNPQVVWITYSGYAAGQKVYRTDNGGASWTNISGTLPNLPVNTIEYDKNTGILYLGTDVGVFVRTPAMTDWQVFDTGLPNVIVTELEIQYSAARIRAATFGRGLWESDLYSNPVATYCVPVYHTGCTAGYYIHNFSLHHLVNNSTGCSNATATGYTNYAPAGTLTTTVNRGQSYPLQVQAGSGLAQYFGVWIDYNGDKDFNDAGELVYASPTAATTLFTTNITIPATAALGATRLRVRSRSNSMFTGAASCTAYTSGEAEDYTITIAGTTTASTQWNYRFGGSDADEFTAAAKASDGGILLGGFSRSPVNGDKTVTSQGALDYWIVKVNSTGSKQWDKRFGGTSDDYLNCMIPTSDGGFLLAGNSLSGAGGDKTQASQGGRDIWVVKISGTGVKQWEKRFGGAGDEEPRGLLQLTTGEYVVAGFSASGAGGDKSQASQGGFDFWLLKISSSGTRLWDKRFGGSGSDYLEGMVLSSDGGFLLGGRSSSGISGDKTQASWGGTDIWIVKVSSTGSKQWDKRFGGSSTDELFGLLGTSDGHYLLAGNSSSGISGDKTQASWGGTDMWIVKVSSTGSKQWDKRYGGSSTDELRSVIEPGTGGFLLGGRSNSAISGDKTQASQGLKDYFLVKISPAGAKEWDKRYGGTGEEELRTVLQATDGGFLLGGRSASGISGDKTQASWGQNDYWLVKVGSSGTAAPITAAVMAEPPVAEVLMAERSPENTGRTLLVRPNPFTHTVRLQFTLTRQEQVSLKVFNAQGAEVATLFWGEAEAGKSYRLEWRAEQQKAGVYIVQLATPGKAIYQRVVHIR